MRYLGSVLAMMTLVALAYAGHIDNGVTKQYVDEKVAGMAPGSEYVTNNASGVSFSGTTTLTNLVVSGSQTNLGPVNLAGNVQYGGTNAALWYITTTNAYLDVGTNRIYLTP